jgi:LDH2 family malate/lactate/ureidoglycolate dehydrogenase
MTAGYSKEDAYIIADCLVDADLCGVETHGVLRAGVYLNRIEKGVIDLEASLLVERESAAGLLLNANNGIGMVQASKTMKRCIEKAKQSGCCVATLKNGNHFGMTAYYVKIAAEQNMIGFLCTNAPSNMAPWGSSKPYFGTNPFAIAAPSNGMPLVLDMATSVVAMGKITMSAKLGKDIPLGWAIDCDGNPTTDAEKAANGTVLPVGGPKGYGMAMFIDVLSGALSGAMIGPHIGYVVSKAVDFKPQQLGHFFCVIDIDQFVPIAEFKQRIDTMRQEIKAYPKNEDVSEIFMPGEIEQIKKNERMKKGIEIPAPCYFELKALGEKYSVPIEF